MSDQQITVTLAREIEKRRQEAAEDRDRATRCLSATMANSYRRGADARDRDTDRLQALLDPPQPERYTVEEARARLRETFATHEWPQDGTDLEYFLRAVFPDPAQLHLEATT